MVDSKRDLAIRPAALLRRLEIPADATVADIGAGEGFLTNHLAAAVPRGRVIATDLRSDRLAIAARRVRAAGLHNVETRVVCAGDPGLAPDRIDLAVLCQVDHHLPDRDAYLRALVATLTPGGQIVLVNFARYYQANMTACPRASLRIVDDWSPSPAYFLLVARAG